MRRDLLVSQRISFSVDRPAGVAPADYRPAFPKPCVGSNCACFASLVSCLVFVIMRLDGGCASAPWIVDRRRRGYAPVLLLCSSALLCMLSLVCSVEISRFSHRFRTVLRTLGAVNQISTDAQVREVEDEREEVEGWNSSVDNGG